MLRTLIVLSGIALFSAHAMAIGMPKVGGSVGMGPTTPVMNPPSTTAPVTPIVNPPSTIVTMPTMTGTPKLPSTVGMGTGPKGTVAKQIGGMTPPLPVK